MLFFSYSPVYKTMNTFLIKEIPLLSCFREQAYHMNAKDKFECRLYVFVEDY